MALVLMYNGSGNIGVSYQASSFYADWWAFLDRRIQLSPQPVLHSRQLGCGPGDASPFRWE